MSPNENLLLFLVVLAIFGLIVGAIARLLIPGPNSMGILATMAAGIAGAFLGGLVGKLIFGSGYTPGWIASILGAMAVVALVSRSWRRPGLGRGSRRGPGWRRPVY